MFPAEELVNEAVKTAEKIAGLSKIAVELAKEAEINSVGFVWLLE